MRTGVVVGGVSGWVWVCVWGGMGGRMGGWGAPPLPGEAGYAKASMPCSPAPKACGPFPRLRQRH